MMNMVSNKIKNSKYRSQQSYNNKKLRKYTEYQDILMTKYNKIHKKMTTKTSYKTSRQKQ